MKRTFAGMMLALIILAAPVFGAPPVAVPEAAQPKVVLNALVQEALKNNPRLKAARYRADAAQARVALFRSVPDPMVEYEYDRITPGLLSMGGKVQPMRSLSVSQEIPFPTKILMRQASARQEAHSFEQEYRETERTVVKDVKSAYFTLLLNRQKLSFIRDALSLMGQFVEVANKKFAVNKAGQSDVLRAQVEYSKLSNTVVLYQKEARIAGDLLVSVLGREDGAPVDVAPADPIKDVALQEEDVVALAKKDRPELKAVKAMMDRAAAESSLSEQELLPDFTVKYKRDDPDRRLSRLDQGEWTASVGVTVPLWFWGKQLPQIREARANLDAAKADYTAAENTAVFEAKSAFARYDAARELVAVYETGVLPQAGSSVVTARRAYESGSLSFLELLETLRTLRDLQMEYFEQVADMQVSLADLEQAVGGDLGK